MFRTPEAQTGALIHIQLKTPSGVLGLNRPLLQDPRFHGTRPVGRASQSARMLQSRIVNDIDTSRSISVQLPEKFEQTESY